MGTTAVDVQDISKRFRLYYQKYTSLKERVIHAGRNPYTDLWALRNISFEVQEGETLGILGMNGSGKSTLLKCICGVLRPTSGQVVVRGKLAGLLELGAGFQPELTGRENVYLNGSLLGIPKSTMSKVFDEVVAFAELEQFIDNQVKFYSSGMYVRLGFAVAVTVDPDILVIDEVLTVGDERFQRKCMDRVHTFQQEGRTIIVVSHSPDQIRSMCDRAVVLSDGQMIAHTPPGEAVRIFRENLLQAGSVLRASATATTQTAGTDPEAVAVTEHGVAPEASGAPSPGIEAKPGPPSSAERAMANEGARNGTASVQITDVVLTYPGSDERPYMVTGDPLSVRIGFIARSRVSGVDFFVELRDGTGRQLLRSAAGDLEMHFDLEAGTGEVEFSYDMFPFVDGTYEIVVGVESSSGGVLVDYRDPAAKLEVMHPGKALGTVVLPVRIGLSTTSSDHA